MSLGRALGISSGDVVAFVGAGGKSSAIIAISGELIGDGLSVLVAPTTKMFLDEVDKLGPLLTSPDQTELRDSIERSLVDSQTVVAGTELLSKQRVSGIEPGWVSEFAGLADIILVEADGSRRRPLKGTADHEPLLPDSMTLVVAVGNVTALGKPLNETNVHRPEVFSELTGVGLDQSVTPRAFATAIARGSLGKIPAGARKAALITGVQPGPLMSEASVVARELWRLGLKNVVLSSLPDEIPGRVWSA